MDSTRYTFYLCSLVGGAMLFWLALRTTVQLGKPSAELPPERPGRYVLFLVAAILLLRWPFVLDPVEMDVDESQMLAQGLRLLRHPVPWRDMDGTTSGPLNSYAISACSLLGAPVSLAGGRMLSALMQVFSLVFLYLCLRRLTGWVGARWLMLPFVCFYSYCYLGDFLHYNSEGLPVLLMSAAVGLMAPVLVQVEVSPLRWFSAGVLLGAVPLAKLQASFMAVFLWLLLAGLYLSQHGRRVLGLPSVWRRLGAYVAGAICVPLVILGTVFVCGAAADFSVSYLKAAVEYAGKVPVNRLDVLWTMLTVSRYIGVSFFMFLLVSAPVIGATFRGGFNRTPGHLAAALAALAWLLVCLYSVLASGKVFLHYLLLLIPGLVVGVIVLASGTGGRWQTSGWLGKLRCAPYGWLVLLGGWILLQTVAARSHFVNGRASLARHEPGPSPVVAAIAAAVRPGEEISVWGWMPVYYVQTGCPPATRDAICHLVIEPGKYQSYYRQRHLADLQQSRPPVFIDAAVAGAFLWPGWPPDSRHESFPELADYIRENYVLWRSVPLADQARPVRIYLSRERYEMLKKAALDGPAPLG